MVQVLLGVDGGSSKTNAVIADETGRVLGVGRAGGSNMYDDPLEDCLYQIERSVMSAVEDADLGGTDGIDLATFSLCGADWPEDFTLLRHRLEERRLAARFQIVNDAIGGLYAGLPTGAGVAMIVGTGVAAAARGPSGEEWHSSFWTLVGGGTDLAWLAMEATWREYLGVGKPTVLTQWIPERLGVRDVPELLHAMTKLHGIRPSNWKDATRLLLDAAHDGDDVAREIVAKRGDALGEMAVASLHQVHAEAGDNLTLVFGGGVFAHPGDLMETAMIERVHQDYPHAAVVRKRCTPVVGALRHAFLHAGLSIEGIRCDVIEDAIAVLVESAVT